MGFLFSGLFWGVVIILLGITVILKAVFHVDIPLFRIIFALCIIYFGLRVLVGGFHGGKERQTVVFGESRLSLTDDSEYNVVFGKGSLDLSGVEPGDRSDAIEFTTVFGKGTLIVNPNVPMRIKVSSAFGGVRMPDGTNIAFGDYTYRSKAYKEGSPFLNIKAAVVFGNLAVKASDSAVGPGPKSGNSTDDED